MTIEITAPEVLIWALVGLAFVSAGLGITKAILEWKVFRLQRQQARSR